MAGKHKHLHGLAGRRDGRRLRLRAFDGFGNVVVRPALDEEVEAVFLVVGDRVLADGGDEFCF